MYKHGTYGEFAQTVSRQTTPAGTTAVYIGTAPVNLIRGYKNAVNTPIYLNDLSAAKNKVGYSDDWSKFTLCEAIKAHFDNPAGNVGPIVVINVLNPETHKKVEPTTKSLTFTNKRAVIDGDTIILDTLVLADKIEGTDFTVDYDYNKKQTVITDIGEVPIDEPIEATFSEVDTTGITETEIIGNATDDGVYTGIKCINLIYQELDLITNIIASPVWSENKAVYDAMIEAGTKINGHWDAFVIADIPLESNGTIEKAIKWKTDNGYNNERTKVCYPQAVGTDGKIYHTSTITVWQMLNVDATHNAIPMETPSNKSVFVSKQYFGADSNNRGFDQTKGNDLNANGITTIVYWGGRWVLWGAHTAAYKYGSVTDQRVIFDNSIRMMMYISNSFQQEHALEIDQPMTRAMADTIKNREQEKADALVAIGALIGTPVVSFEETENSNTEIIEGNFVWGFEGTPIPPFKSGTLQVAYTDAGFDSYFGEGV